MQLHQQLLIQLHWSQHIKQSDSLCSSSLVTCLQMAHIHNFNDTRFVLVEGEYLSLVVNV